MASKKGLCAICGSAGPLTTDHVPPKGVTEPRPIEVRNLLAFASAERFRNEAHKSRPGFHSMEFRTICANCNGELMGTLYDPELQKLANTLASWLRGAATLGLVLPAVATITLRPALVARAVVGHLLAAEPGGNRTTISAGEMLDQMRSFFVGKGASRPTFRIFLWPYAATDLVISRGFGISRVLGENPHGPVIGDVLKFFPLAFWVVASAPEGIIFPFAELDLAMQSPVRINISMRGFPTPRWPELPGNSEVILTSDERSLVASRGRRN